MSRTYSKPEVNTQTVRMPYSLHAASLALLMDNSGMILLFTLFIDPCKTQVLRPMCSQPSYKARYRPDTLSS